MAQLHLAFPLGRTEDDSPSTTADVVDITTIKGLDATTVQAALELIYALAKAGGGGSSSVSDYTHKCLTEDEMADLDADDAEEGIIYMSLEGWDGSTSGETTTTWGLGDALPIILT